MPSLRQPSAKAPTGTAKPISHQNVGKSARWQGNPTTRPLTDAEFEVRNARNQRMLRLLRFVLGLALLVVLYTPQWVVGRLLALPPRAQSLVLHVLPSLARIYAWLQFAAFLVLLALVIHLIVALFLFAAQRRNRAAATFQTLALDVAGMPTITPLHGVDLFVGLQRLNQPTGRGRGREETFVFALVGGDDGRMQMRVRGPAPQGRRDWSSFLRQQIEGRAPGTTARPAEDDLVMALKNARPGHVLAWADLVLQRDGSYPLNDLGQFSTDPMGPLAAALGAESISSR